MTSATELSLVLKSTLALSLFVGAALAAAQPQLSAEQYVQRALANSAAVRASDANAQSFNLAARSAGTAANPQIELAPGLGFTNSNMLLSQEFDLFGRRSSQAAVLRAEFERQVIQVTATRMDVAESALRALLGWHSADIKLQQWRRATESAKALLDATRRRFEIGEVPQVHVSRAELELLRTSQEVVRAESKKRVAQQEIESLLGAPIQGSELPPMPSIGAPDTRTSEARSIDKVIAERDVSHARARVRAARADSRPSLSAGLTADLWSLDRRPSVNRDSTGVQFVLRSPLFDRGEHRLRVQSEEQAASAANDRLAESTRLAQLSLQRALAERESAQAILTAYEGEITPKSEAMLKAMQEGYASGLLTLVEVIEAQQALSDLKQEQADAQTDLWLAELALRRALLLFPSLEVPR